jgi:FkbM family methyltransferase
MEYLSKIQLWDEQHCGQHVVGLVNNISNIVKDNEIEKTYLIDIGANVGKVYELLNEKIHLERAYMFEASPMLFGYLETKYMDDEKVSLYHRAINNNEDEVDFDEHSMIHQINDGTELLNFGLSQIKKTEYSTKVKSLLISKFLESNDFLYDEFCFIKIDTETVDFNILQDLLNVIGNFNIKPIIEFEINNKHIDISDESAQEIVNLYYKFGYKEINLKDCWGEGILIPDSMNSMNSVWSLIIKN